MNPPSTLFQAAKHGEEEEAGQQVHQLDSDDASDDASDAAASDEQEDDEKEETGNEVSKNWNLDGSESDDA